MRRFPFALLLALVLGSSLAGCGGGGTKRARTGAGAEAQTEEEAVAGSATVTLAEGTGDVAVTCAAAAAEQCNAVDDNCDGRVDEGCGYGTGPLQITMAWNTRADVDLLVRTPSGELLSSQNPSSAAGGTVDHSARGGCILGTAREATADQIENAVWTTRPASGDYELIAHYWGECTGGGATMVTMTVTAFGQVIGSFNAELEAGEKRSMLTVHVAE